MSSSLALTWTKVQVRSVNPSQKNYLETCSHFSSSKYVCVRVCILRKCGWVIWLWLSVCTCVSVLPTLAVASWHMCSLLKAEFLYGYSTTGKMNSLSNNSAEEWDRVCVCLREKERERKEISPKTVSKISPSKKNLQNLVFLKTNYEYFYLLIISWITSKISTWEARCENFVYFETNLELFFVHVESYQK